MALSNIIDYEVNKEIGKVRVCSAILKSHDFSLIVGANNSRTNVVLLIFLPINKKMDYSDAALWTFPSFEFGDQFCCETSSFLVTFSNSICPGQRAPLGAL